MRIGLEQYRIVVKEKIIYFQLPNVTKDRLSLVGKRFWNNYLVLLATECFDFQERWGIRGQF